MQAIFKKICQNAEGKKKKLVAKKIVTQFKIEKRRVITEEETIKDIFEENSPSLKKGIDMLEV